MADRDEGQWEDIPASGGGGNAAPQGVQAASADEWEDIKPIQAPSVTENPVYQRGEAFKKYGEENFPLTPEQRASFAGQFGGIVGGMLPAVGATLLLGPAGAALGAAQFGFSAAGDTFEEALKKGADEDTAAKAAGISGAIAAGIGTLPLGMVLAPIKQMAPGLTGWAAGKLAQAAVNGVTFSTVGEAQNWIMTQVAHSYYDKEAEYDPSLNRMLAGAVAGGGFGVMHPLRAREAAPGAGEVREPVQPGSPEALAAETLRAMPPGSETAIDINGQMVQPEGVVDKRAQLVGAPTPEPEIYLGPTPNLELVAEVERLNKQQARLITAANEAQDRGDLAERDRLFDQSDEVKKQYKAASEQLRIADAAARGKPTPEAAPPESPERTDLRSALEAGAPLEELEQHPAVLRAVEANRQRVPTGTPEDFADQDWRAHRVYWFGPDDEVHGWDAAVERLTEQAKAFSTEAPVEKGRHAIIVLGPPASGKSSLSEPLARRYRAALVDSDEAKKVIPEYEGGLGTQAAHEESSYLAKEVLTNMVREGGNIVLPKVGHTLKSIQGIVDTLKNEFGYTVDIAHVSATPEITVRRNIARFVKTGRLVEPKYIAEVGDKPREVAHILKGEANEFLDADTSQGYLRILEERGSLADAVRDGRDVQQYPPEGPQGTREGTQEPLALRGKEELFRAAEPGAPPVPLRPEEPDSGKLVSVANKVASEWQDKLGPDIKVVMGGSLVSHTYVHEGRAPIDMDIRFLTDNPERDYPKVEAVTGLKLRKSRPVDDYPSGQSKAFLVEGPLTRDGITFDVEAAVRTPAYVGWARFYPKVLTPDELSAFRADKARLKGNKEEYKALKGRMLAEVKRRIEERGGPAALEEPREPARLAGDEVSGQPPHRVTAADGTTIDVRPLVVEATSLLTSQDQGYDPSLQPRQRERAASQAQVRSIATNLDPERLGYSAEADRGAPIVGPDGMVESGNGRVLAVRSLYTNPDLEPQRDAYLAWLHNQGVDVGKYRQPVLVRQRMTPFTPEERRHFTVAANQAATLAMSAPERAMSDARLIDVNLIRNPDDLGAVANREMVRKFVAGLPQGEQGALVDARGQPSAEGLARIRNAVLAKAYGDAGLLARIAESTNDEIKSISNALIVAAPEWARLREAVQTGAARPGMDATPELMEAVRRTADIRAKGEKLDHYLAQQDAFDVMPKAVEGFMRVFYDPKGRKPAGVKRIADTLKFYAQEAAKVAEEKGLNLGLVPVRAEDILLAKARADETQRAISERYGTGPREGVEAGGRKVRGLWLGEGGEGLGAEGAGRDQEAAVRARREEGPDLFESTPIGQQGVIPGAERVSQAEMAKRRAAQPMQPRKTQQPMDVGLFGERAQQADLLEALDGLRGGPPSDQVRGRTPQVPGREQSQRARKPTPVRRPDQLSLFGGGDGGGDVLGHHGEVPAQPGGTETRPPSPSESVTKPPTGGGGNRAPRHPDAAVAGINEAEQVIAQRTRSNYRITPEDNIGAGGPKQKVRANLDAIRILKQIEEENRDATPAEKAVLVKYTGWGHVAQDMFDTMRERAAWERERSELKALLTKEEYDAARASTPNAHYTSPEVVSGMWDVLDHLGFSGGMAIEPSAGVGHFMGLIPDKVAPKTAWTAVELDSISGRITKALYGNAEVNVHGFEDLKRPSNYYDLAISNVPFGNYPIEEAPYGKFSSIHNFFFVKSLDKVRPGGVVAFVTSSYSMDAPAHAGWRRQIAKTSDLVGAIRLPGGKEGAFAKNAGTQVTTDILFLRKKVPGEAPFPGKSWDGELREIQTPEGPHNINEYYADNPHMMLGEMRLLGTQYKKAEPVLIGDSEGIREKIAEAAKSMQADAMTPRATPAPPTISNVDIGAGIKDGSFFLKDGALYQRRQGVGHAHPLPPEEHDKITRMIGMRDIYNDLIEAQLHGIGDKEALRSDLRDAYKAFVDKYGPINKEIRTVTTRLNKAGEPVVIVRRPNFKLFDEDPDAFKVASIERYDQETGVAKPADIQTKDVLNAPKERQINGPSDALAASLQDKGSVDLDHVARSLGLDTQEEAIKALGDTIWQNPDGRQWETSDEYLSGDVVKKLDDARAIAAEDRSYLRNVAALEKVQPAPLLPHEITAQFGAHWIPTDVYEDFLRSIGGHGGSVVRTPITGDLKLTKWFFSPDTAAKYGHLEYEKPPGVKHEHQIETRQVAEAALTNQQIKVYDEHADGSKTLNQDFTEQAQIKTQLMKTEFTGDEDHGIEGWVWSDHDRAEKLAAIWNRTANNLVDRTYDGSHLTLPGMNPKFTDRQHRKDAIWRMIRSGNTLLNHVVGSGKSATMYGGSMEMKRLGLISKPAHVIPNHMLEQYSREFVEAYPNAKLLVAQKNEMKAEHRRAFMAKVASNNWDAVIFTHDAFGRINMAKEYRLKHIREQLDEYEKVMKAEIKESGKSSATVKNLEKGKKRLQAQLDKLMNEERKDEGTNFEESGIDFLFVDEAHKFKNLSFLTRLGRVKGLGGSADAQRAEDLFLKMRYLDEKRPGRSAVFATGTPVSNTIGELWTMMRYLEYDALKERGLDNFDSWANTFGNIETSLELGPDGRTLQPVASFSKFVNIPELTTLFSRISDTKTADMLNLPRPEVVTNGHPGIEIVKAYPSAQEEKFMQGLVDLLESIKGQRPEKGKPGPLSIMSAGRKVAADGRLVGKTTTDQAVLSANPDLREGFDFNPRGKVALAVNNIFKIYQEGKDPALAQMVFIDMGVPKTKGKKKFVTGEETEEDNIDLYGDIKKRLVEKGIPAHEIASIHDADNDDKKAKLFDKVRKGTVRVIMGSSEKMGVGTNVQDKLIAMHHIDAPWRPADIEQRDGRIVRQGNLNDKVQIYRYVTERSMDAVMWQTLERKARFLTQLLSGAKGSRTMQDIDNPLPEAAAMKAAASGDPRMLEHAELDRQVRNLTAQKRNFDSTKARSTWELGNAQHRIKQLETSLPDAREDAAGVADLRGERFSVDLGGVAVTERKAAGEAILKRLMEGGSYYRPTDITVGKMSGFDMQVEMRSIYDGVEGNVLSAQFSLRSEKNTYSAAIGAVINEQSDPVGFMRKFENILANIKSRPEVLEAQAKGERETIARLEKTASGTWPKEKDYREALEKLNALEKDLKAPKHPDVHEAEVKASMAAYHGSPHKFERFDTSKIGTGEGAQAYGHGLYFAEREGIAQDYRKKLSGGPGQKIPSHVMAALKAIDYLGFDRAGEALNALRGDIQRGVDWRKNWDFSGPGDEAHAAVIEKYLTDEERGALYRVSLRPDKEDLLDWDKPLSEQSEKVKAGVARAFGDWRPPDYADAMDGANIIRFLGGGEKASKALSEAGIPGIKYVDAGSRPRQAEIDQLRRDIERWKQGDHPPEEIKAQEEKLADLERQQANPTHNFVIFNDKDIEITHRNGEELSKQERKDAVEELKARREAAVSEAAKPTERAIRIGRETEAHVRPYTEKEQKLADAIAEIGDRMAPQANIRGAAALRQSGQRIWGGFVNSKSFPQLIVWSLERGDPSHAAQTVRHEIIHHLRNAGLFKPDEWAALRDAAVTKDWLGKYKIPRRYGDLPLDHQIEEAVADHFGKWRTERSIEKPGLIRDAFQRLDLFMRRVAAEFRRAFGARATASDVFTRIETGEVGRRPGKKPTTQEASEREGNEGRTVSSPKMQEAVLRNTWRLHGQDLDYDDIWNTAAGDRLWNKEVSDWNKAHGTNLDPDNMNMDIGATTPTGDFLRAFEKKHLAGKKAPFPGVKKANEYFEDGGEPQHAAYLESDERAQRSVQTETPEFKRWFGDSKVVENGEPKVVYHGTDAEDFSSFERSEDIGFHFGTAKVANARVGASPNAVRETFREGGPFEHQEDRRLVPVFLKIKKPLRLPDLNDWSPRNVIRELEGRGIISEKQADEADIVDRDTVKRWLAAKGYDGIVYKNGVEAGGKGGDSYIVFDPTQIKSATGNRGTFDPTKADIRASRPDEPPAKLHDGLDLNDAEDRSIFRQRVAQYFSKMRLWAVQQEAGLGKRATATQARRVIADRWIKQLTGVSRASGGRVNAADTRRESHYSATRGTPERHCGEDKQWQTGWCKHFRKPHGCTEVGGVIAPRGSCDWYKWVGYPQERADGGAVDRNPFGGTGVNLQPLPDLRDKIAQLAQAAEAEDISTSFGRIPDEQATTSYQPRGMYARRVKAENRGSRLPDVERGDPNINNLMYRGEPPEIYRGFTHADGGAVEGPDLPVMVDPLAGKRSIGERPDVQEFVKDYAKSVMDPLAKVGAIIMGRSAEPFQDAGRAAIGAVMPPVARLLARPAVALAGKAFAKGTHELARDVRPEVPMRASGGRVLGHYIDHNPSEAQKRANNYKHAHVRIHGLDIAIENAKGSERTGIGKDGKPWRVTMKAHYGYVKGHMGADQDHLDTYLGPHHQSKKVFLVDQHDADTGKFDEVKILLGFGNAVQARAIYLKGFSDGRGKDRLRCLTEMDIDTFKAWLDRRSAKAPVVHAAASP